MGESTGFVGIGTTNPHNKLDVLRNAITTMSQMTNGGAAGVRFGIRCEWEWGDWYYGSHISITSATIKLCANNPDTLSISSNGNPQVTYQTRGVNTTTATVLSTGAQFNLF